MTLELEEIKEQVNETEAEQADWRKDADRYLEMWSLVTDKSPEEVRELERREQVTLPTPYNVIQLVKRLIGGQPKIEILAAHASEGADEKAEKRERWINAAWIQAQKQQRRNYQQDWVWQAGVMGKCAARTLWVYDELPKHLKNRRLPFMVQPLDPRQVGVREGPLYTEHAYHRYMAKRSWVKQLYPNVKLEDRRGRSYARVGRDSLVTVIDYYWTTHDGTVWHAVVVDDEFAEEPYKTWYPEVPIVVAAGDSTPLGESRFQYMSMLHGLRELYPYQNRLASKLATGMLYYFDPVFWTKNLLDDVEIGPGMTVNLGKEGEMGVVQPQVNLQLTQAMLQIVEGQIQQATFPSVMFGEQPGQVQAGYGINILAKQAGGRISEIRINLENMIERIVSMIFQQVEKFVAETPELEGGVAVWGREEGSRTPYQVSLSPEDIDDYDCEVSITADLPTDDAARVALWMQMRDSQAISTQTFRDLGIDVPLPKDEDLRVATEQLMQSEAFLPKYQLQAAKERFPDSWERMIANTPLEQVAQAEAQWEEQEALRKLEEQRQKALRKLRETGSLPKGWRVLPDGRVVKRGEDLEQGPASPMPNGPMPMPPGPMPGGPPAGGPMGSNGPMPAGPMGGPPPGGPMPGGGGGVNVPGGAVAMGLPPGPEQGLQSALVQGQQMDPALLARVLGPRRPRP